MLYLLGLQCRREHSQVTEHSQNNSELEVVTDVHIHLSEINLHSKNQLGHVEVHNVMIFNQIGKKIDYDQDRYHCPSFSDDILSAPKQRPSQTCPPIPVVAPFLCDKPMIILVHTL